MKSPALYGEELTCGGGVAEFPKAFATSAMRIDGFLKMLAKSSEHLPVNGESTQFTILECAPRVLAVTGSAKQNTLRIPQDDPKHPKPISPRLKPCCGWEPKIDLDTGLRMSLERISE